jgi:hypothetical protein
MYLQEKRKTIKIQDSQPTIRDVSIGHTANGEAVLPT